jgi:hypothetical protein
VIVLWAVMVVVSLWTAFLVLDFTGVLGSRTYERPGTVVARWEPADFGAGYRDRDAPRYGTVFVMDDGHVYVTDERWVYHVVSVDDRVSLVFTRGVVVTRFRHLEPIE